MKTVLWFSNFPRFEKSKTPSTTVSVVYLGLNREFRAGFWPVLF
jgi:hypothetical protein